MNIETEREVDCYQLLGTNVRTEAEHFPQNDVFQRDGAPPHSTCAVSSVMDERAQSHGLEDVIYHAGQQDHPTQPHWNIFFVDS